MRRFFHVTFNYARDPQGGLGTGVTPFAGGEYTLWDKFVAGASEVYLVKAFGAAYVYNSTTYKRRSISAVFELPFAAYREAISSSDFVSFNSYTTVNQTPPLCFSSGTQFFYKMDSRLNLVDEPSLVVGVRSMGPTDAVDFASGDAVFFVVNLEFEFI